MRWRFLSASNKQDDLRSTDRRLQCLCGLDLKPSGLQEPQCTCGIWFSVSYRCVDSAWGCLTDAQCKEHRCTFHQQSSRTVSQFGLSVWFVRQWSGKDGGQMRLRRSGTLLMISSGNYYFTCLKANKLVLRCNFSWQDKLTFIIKGWKKSFGFNQSFVFLHSVDMRRVCN